MALDICVETYGAAVHIFDAIVGSGILLRGKDGERRAMPEVVAPTFDARVRFAADGLPFAEAQALWLVDVCACSYGEAADMAGVDREVFSSRVRSARRAVRSAAAISTDG